MGSGSSHITAQFCYYTSVHWKVTEKTLSLLFEEVPRSRQAATVAGEPEGLPVVFSSESASACLSLTQGNSSCSRALPVARREHAGGSGYCGVPWQPHIRGPWQHWETSRTEVEACRQSCVHWPPKLRICNGAENGFASLCWANGCGNEAYVFSY